ncbi:MAG: transposase family protein, partial [Tannerella sp.]|nr:transposase family protein [Tannerella sp.]
MRPKSNLLTCLSAGKDPRRQQGQRYSINAMLTIIIMCALRNRSGYHETGRFCEHNREKLIKMFGFGNGRVPSCVTFHSFIKATNFASLQSAFHQWTKEYVRIEEGEWPGIDGK